MTFDLNKLVTSIEAKYRAEFDPDWHSDKLKDPAYKARFIAYLERDNKHGDGSPPLTIREFDD